MKTIILYLAKAYFTPERLKALAQEALTALAAKAKEKGGDTAQAILGKTEKLAAAMQDGIVDEAETESLLGDVITQANVDKLFAGLK